VIAITKFGFYICELQLYYLTYYTNYLLFKFLSKLEGIMFFTERKLKQRVEELLRFELHAKNYLRKNKSYL